MREIKFAVVFLIIILKGFMSGAQSLPVGTGLDEYYRSAQLLGNLDSLVSFTIRPLFPSSLKITNILDTDSLPRTVGENKNRIRFLPVLWQQQYNTHHAYGWNDGSMIPAKGYQTLFSTGVFLKYGPLSIRLSPEFIFAENKFFKEFQSYFGGADITERYGNQEYTKVFWGQSSIRLNFGPVSLGLSNENLWWGPGINNALLMSNSVSGFKHLTLNTVRPIHTAIGSVEGQIIAGRLEGSEFSINKEDDWRYLSGMILSYQPKWIPGLFLGLSRSFQMYSKDMHNSFGDYFPIFQAFQKINTHEGEVRRDQLTSLFSRWYLKRAKAELYFEYGLNDHSYNFRDFLMSPEHSRAYIFGIRKLLPFKNSQDEYIQVSLEHTKMAQSVDRIIREAGEWYTHSQITHGYTHRGEVLGAGIGPGSNLHSFDISWIKGVKRIGLQLERYVHNNDFYYSQILSVPNHTGQWVDLSFAASAGWAYKSLLFNTKVQAIESVNYQWMSGLPGFFKQNAFNLHASLGILYRF